MLIGNKEFATGHKTYIMGILNVTPDSFYDGGRYTQIDKALKRVEEMMHEGMDLLDLGGESSRPGHLVIDEQEEMQRVLPILEAVKKNIDIPISLDTYKSRVAFEGIKAGADMINDIYGLQYDPDMASVVASAKVAYCLMHNRKEAVYRSFLEDVVEDLADSLTIAQRAGIAHDRIILDPGIGFGKTTEHNLEMIRHLEVLDQLGDYPRLLAASNKSVIGNTLELPIGERLEGTLVTTVFGVLKGCSFIRVHDIEANRRAIRMTEALCYIK